MKILKKLNTPKQPPGLEWKIFKRLPRLFLASTLIPLMVSLLGRLVYPFDSDVDRLKEITSIDIFSIAMGVTLWTAVFTLAIGCIVVIIMKGPTYVADSYEMKDSNYPVQRRGKR